MHPFPISALSDAVVTFEVARAGERRRYRIDSRQNTLTVQELLPVHVRDYYPGMLDVADCWSAVFRAPEPVLSIAMRGFARLFRPSGMDGHGSPSWSSLYDSGTTTVDLGTFEVDAINPPTSTAAA